MAQPKLEVASSTEIKIDKDAGPMPASKTRGKYPWAAMDVGDSFLFPPSTNFAHEASRSASVRFAPKKFVTRISPEGRRCWRIA